MQAPAVSDHDMHVGVHGKEYLSTAPVVVDSGTAPGPQVSAEHTYTDTNFLGLVTINYILIVNFWKINN